MGQQTSRFPRPVRVMMVLACSGLAAAPAVAQEEEPADDPPFWERDQLTGTWWGARDTLADAGLTFDPYAVVDFSKNTRGGADTQGSAFRSLLSLNATAGLDTILGLTGASVFVDFHQQSGQFGSDEVGDWQWVGSWDADGLTQVSELYFEQELAEGTWRFKLGKIDANNEFAYTDLGWQFVHGSASYPATNALLPTYPNPATGAAVFFYPDDHWSFAAGVFDGAAQEGHATGGLGPATFFGDPADLYFIGEAGYAWSLGEDAKPGRVNAGLWRHTGSFDRWDGGVDDGTTGFYAVAEQMVWIETEPEEDAGITEIQGVGIYAQLDWADGAVFDLEWHLGFGATWRGGIDGRDDDVLGLGVSLVDFTEDAAAGYADDPEAAVEGFYRWQVIPSSAVQPYVQFISNPGNAGLDDAVNLGVRLEVWF